MLAMAVVALLPATSSGQAAKGTNINLAEARFRLGRFTEAEEIATAVLDRDPTHFRAALLRGRVALLGNRLTEATQWAEQAREIRPTHNQPREMLAEISYRQDNFAAAAKRFEAAGREVRAAQLASFEDRRPYSSSGTAGRVELPFVQTDPLPVVRIRVNGSEPAAFILDTGGAEVIVDTEWAASIGIESVGSDTGTFAGGRKAAYGRGRADSLTLGDLELRDVPVQILDTAPFSAVAPGEEIRGVLGTVLFYHFRTTIDYPGGRLVLEPRAATPADSRDAALARVPFLLAGDHYLLANGSVNDDESSLFLVDTGLAGLGFTCPQSTLDKAGVELMQTAAGKGVGGGGPVQIVPFILESLSLGDLRREQIPGVFGPFPPTLEHNKGFRIGGLISHGFFRPYAITFDFDSMELVIW